jgi:hypothetical protein
MYAKMKNVLEPSGKSIIKEKVETDKDGRGGMG